MENSMRTLNIAERMQTISREVGMVNRNLHGCFPEDSIAALRLSDFAASLEILSVRMRGINRAMDDCAARYESAEEQASNDLAGLRAGSSKSTGKSSGAAGEMSRFGEIRKSVSPAVPDVEVGRVSTVITAASFTQAEIKASVRKREHRKEVYIWKTLKKPWKKL